VIKLSDRRLMAAYSIAETAHYLGVPPATVRYWATGSGTHDGVISVAGVNPVLLSFINLVELHVLTAMRRQHGVRLPKIRAALDFVSKDSDGAHPLVEHDFETDGVDLFVQHFGELVNASRNGQMALKQLIESALQRVERDDSGIPIRLYPYTRSLKKESPRIIMIDPEISGGRPVIEGTGIAIDAIAERFDAGESIGDLAYDYDCEREFIEEAIRYEARAA